MALQIRSEIKDLSSVERELAIVVPGDTVAKELDRAYKELSMKVKLKGFRPGKVPRYVLEQYYKKETEQQVLEKVVNSSFRQAIKNHEISPVNNPAVQAPSELIAGMDFSYSAKVEVKPVIDLKNWEGLALDKTVYTVSDKDIDAELARMREAHAKVAPVVGRDVIQQGDLVETNWSGTVDGEPVKGLSGVAFVIEVGGKTFPYPEAHQALVGKTLGEDLSVDVKLPADFRLEALRDKTAVFKMRPLAIKEKTLPALDDEFAKDVSEKVETLEQLKGNISGELDKAATQRTKNQVRDAVITALVDGNPFEVPASLIDRQCEQVVVDRLQRLPQQQAEMIWQMQGQRLKEEARPQATRTVRISLLLEELVKRDGIKVTDAELEEHLENMARELNTPLKTVKQVFAKDNRLDELEFQLATQKALDKVIAAAKFNETSKSLSE
jgi:trigger factor